MTFNQWYFVGLLWGLIALLGAVTDLAAAGTASSEGINQVFGVQFVNFDDVDLSGNPFVAGWNLLGVGKGALVAVFNFAVFNTGIFRSELGWYVRSAFFVPFGIAIVMTEGKDFTRMILGFIRG